MTARVQPSSIFFAKLSMVLLSIEAKHDWRTLD